MEKNTLTNARTTNNNQVSFHFYNDVLGGLTSTPKTLDAKYFYDATGDRLFQDIMDSREYYLTDSEMEIFSTQTAGLAEVLTADGHNFDLIELGAGDATKSIHLLKYLMKKQAQFTYLPIDISENIIDYLNLMLPVSLPGIRMQALNGDYFDMLKRASVSSNKRKVVLFLGANIGNMSVEKAGQFILELRNHLSPGDLTLIGIDLKKNPKVVLAAYNDAGSITKMFNLNLLSRINRELFANFDINQFDHYPTYDPATGACKSYLISLRDQDIKLGAHKINFKKDEYIHMEISQKYSIEDVEQMAIQSGFRPLQNFTDQKNWFIDAIWQAT
jgi:L-histidine N-alpha-methyltransferase